MKINPKFWAQKRVLVTGHTGFKGAWLTALLDKLGAATFGFSLLPPVDSQTLYRFGIRTNSGERIGDIRDFDVIRKAIAEFKPDIIFHLAAQALVLPSYEDPQTTFSTNVVGTVNVLMAALDCASTKVVINVTSDKCYENNEWTWPYREIDPMGGHDPYSASKGCAELVANSLRRSFYNKKFVSLPSVRAGNVIGGGDWSPYRLVPDVLSGFASGKTVQIRNPSAIRPWQHVLDPVRAYVVLAEKAFFRPLETSRSWNIGPDPDSAQTVQNLVRTLAKMWGESRYEFASNFSSPHEATFLKLDSTLLRSELGWRPVLDYAKSLEFTVDWYKRFYNGERAGDLCSEQLERFLLMEPVTESV